MAFPAYTRFAGLHPARLATDETNLDHPPTAFSASRVVPVRIVLSGSRIEPLQLPERAAPAGSEAGVGR